MSLMPACLVNTGLLLFLQYTPQSTPQSLSFLLPVEEVEGAKQNRGELEKGQLG